MEQQDKFKFYGHNGSNFKYSMDLVFESTKNFIKIIMVNRNTKFYDGTRGLRICLVRYISILICNTILMFYYMIYLFKYYNV